MLLPNARQACILEVVKKPLRGVAEQIEAIRFHPNSNAVILEGKRQVYEVGIAPESPGKPEISARLPSSQVLPKRVNVRWQEQSLEVDVFDWHCAPAKGQR